MSYSTVQEVFDKGMRDRFRPLTGDKVNGLFVVKGVGAYLVKIDGDKLDIEGPNAAPDSDVNVKFELSQGDMLDLANGTGQMQLLFMTGRLRVEGDLPSVMKLVKCFPA